MLRKNQGRQFLVGREDIANFDIQDFDDAIVRRDHIEFAQFCFDLGELRMHLHNAHAGRVEALFFCCRGAPGALGFVRGNCFRAEQSLLSAGIGLHELELRNMGIGIAHRGIDLGLCEIAARLHFRGDELRQRLSVLKRVAFLHKEFFYPASGARGDVHFVDFNRARNRLGTRPASGEEVKRRPKTAARKRKFDVCKAPKGYQLPLETKGLGLAGGKRTMKTRRFDHIDLRVKDMVAAQRFYGQLLPALGFSVASGDDELRTYQCPGKDRRSFFALKKERIIGLTRPGSPSGRNPARKWIG